MGSLFLDALISLVGFCILMYGKKANAFKAILVGMAMMGYPYFVHDTVWSLVIGAGLLLFLWFPR